MALRSRWSIARRPSRESAGGNAIPTFWFINCLPFDPPVPFIALRLSLAVSKLDGADDAVSVTLCRHLTTVGVHV